ncbi:MAG: Na+/H+ antiporter NhaC family protein [Acutalibacteraceae bacterium]|nr:Na+/H+ antiporter NhaC family protein [Acutalibacteraceae bacterium]
MNQDHTPKPNGKALFPILVFLLLYLGVGVYFEYIRPVDGQMGFYIMSVVLAFTIALIVALLQNRTLSFDEKIHLCAKGIGDDNITIMLFIFLFAGMFSGVAQEAGGATSTANLLLDILPGTFAVPGLFLIACLISMAMGTSVGTISVLVPISTALANNAHLNLAFCTAVVVGGAMFGDNLSFISDTTIAATKTQGVEMKDKFRTNFKIALPAALITLGILIVYSVRSHTGDLGHFDYNIWQAIPYFIVLIASLFGLNVLLLLGSGTVLFIIVGCITHSLTFASALTSMGSGMNGMFETIIVTILVASIGALIKENGGYEAILQFIRKHSKGKRGGMFGIAGLTALMDISAANNTVAIVISAPIAKQISEEFHIEPKKTASLLDTVSCIFQGIIPYGAQLLVAAGLAKISSVEIIPYLYYQFLLAVCVILSIVFQKSKKQDGSSNSAELQSVEK